MLSRLKNKCMDCPKKSVSARALGVGSYGTAYHALHHSAEAHASETVLVHGASGGVGSAAVQMARAMGSRSLAPRERRKAPISSSAKARIRFRSPHAGYQEEILKATGGRGVDIVLEMLANVNLSADLKLLAPMGE